MLSFATGCGSDSTPADAAPELATRLEKVDAAIASGDFGRARTAVTALVTATSEAEDAGDITGDQADQILAAAADLLAHLPDTAPAEPAASDSATEPSSTPTPDKPEERGKGKNKDNGNSKDKDKGKGNGNSKDKDNKGNGGGKDSGKGNGNGDGAVK